MIYLTVQEFAERMRMHPGTIRKSIKQGRIYATRTSTGKRSHFRIPETELERLHLECMCKVKP